MKMIVEHHGIKITIEGDSEHFLGQDLYTRAVGALVWRVDTDGWERHNLKHQLDVNTLESFCAAVLSALTLMYSGKTKLPMGNNFGGSGLGDIANMSGHTIRELLFEMLEHFRDNRLLNTTIDAADRDDDDDTCSSRIDDD